MPLDGLIEKGEYMNPKYAKVNAEIDKVKTKITELQARLRDLERQKTEIENTEIVELVRSVDATPQELAAIIRTCREQSRTPLFHIQEDSQHE
jgi:hypothetical protein